MHAAWFPFSKISGPRVTAGQLTKLFKGQGPRSCAGRPIAEMEILLVISTLVRNFRLGLHESTTEDSMRCVMAGSSTSPEPVVTDGVSSGMDTGVLVPNADRCLIAFNLEPLALV